jgi:hypothetical protein
MTGCGTGFSGAAEWSERWRPVLIMVGLVLAQGLPQMVLIPDQGAVQEFAAASADPAFGYRIHVRGPHVAEHGPDPCASEDRIERGGVVRACGVPKLVQSI